jgi:hypothetical protein
MEEKGELDDADPLGAFFKKIFAQVGVLQELEACTARTGATED